MAPSSNSSGKPLRSGPKPRYGPRSPLCVHWPADHRQRYEAEARARGLPLGEYLIRVVARAHGLPAPDLPVPDDGSDQLAMGA